MQTHGKAKQQQILLIWKRNELFLSQDAIVLVKHSILQTMWFMIPAMAVTGGNGFALSGKKKRMQIMAAPLGDKSA